MANKQDTTPRASLQAILQQDEDWAREMIRRTVQEVLEQEMTELLGAGKSERTSSRSGYRAGYYERTLVTRVGSIELGVPQDREGRFSTSVFERYQRSEKALVAAMAEMYFQGVSRRKVKAVTEELCGHSVSAGTISNLVKKLDASLEAFAGRRLEEPYPYVILDARYEKVRAEGMSQSRAVLVALGVDAEGRRQVLGVELANRESRSSWREFLLALKQRGLSGVEYVVSDDHAGLRRAIEEVLSEAVWQRCYVHFLRNALGSHAAQAGRRLLAGVALAVPPPRPSRGAPGPGCLAGALAGPLPGADGLGRGAYRGDLHLLPAAAGAPQTHEVDQHAGTLQRRVAAAHAGDPDLPQPGQLPAADPGPGGGDPRALAGGQSLPEHGVLAGTPPTGPAPGGLRRTGARSRALPASSSSPPNPGPDWEGCAQPPVAGLACTQLGAGHPSMGRYPAAAKALRRVNLREHDAKAPPAANTKKILQNILDTTTRLWVGNVRWAGQWDAHRTVTGAGKCRASGSGCIR